MTQPPPTSTLFPYTTLFRSPTGPKGLALAPAEVPQDPHRLVVEVLAGVDGRGPVVDLGVQLLHPSVELVGGVGRLGEFVDQPVGDVAVELVVDLVLQTGPEVHGDRADLDFADDRHRSAVEEHGHLEDRVQAAIAIRLRVGDVVLDLDDPDVVLRGEQFEHMVGVGDEAAGDADACDVRDLLADDIDLQRQTAAADLRQQAPRRLHPRGDVLDRVVAVGVDGHLAQDRDLREHLVDDEPMLHDQPGEVHAQGAQAVELFRRHRRFLGSHDPPAVWIPSAVYRPPGPQALAAGQPSAPPSTARSWVILAEAVLRARMIAGTPFLCSESMTTPSPAIAIPPPSKTGTVMPVVPSSMCPDSSAK